MTFGLPRFIQNTLLVLGSLVFSLLMIEGASWLLLKWKGPRAVIEPRFPDDISSFDDARRLARGSGRMAELARIILGNNFEKRKSLYKTFDEDQMLRSELPEYLPSDRNNPLWIRPHRVTPNLDDNFRLIGADSRQVKYEAHYTTDEFGRRKGWPKGKKNLLFLGDSFTFGQGVNDEETFPYYVGKKLGLRTYNVGIPGSSPAGTLNELRKKTIPGVITQDETTVIFTLIPEHIVRLIGTISFFRNGDTFFTHQPFAHLVDHELVIENSFSSDPTFRKHFLYLLSRLNFPLALGIDYPEIGDEEFSLIARVIRELEVELRKNYPQIKDFIVSLFPTGNARVNYRKLRDVLISDHLKVFDYSSIDGPTLLYPSYFLRFDWHPSPLTHELYSELLIHDLKENGLL